MHGAASLSQCVARSAAFQLHSFENESISSNSCYFSEISEDSSSSTNAGIQDESYVCGEDRTVSWLVASLKLMNYSRPIQS